MEDPTTLANCPIEVEEEVKLPKPGLVVTLVAAIGDALLFDTLLIEEAMLLVVLDDEDKPETGLGFEFEEIVFEATFTPDTILIVFVFVVVDNTCCCCCCC